MGISGNDEDRNLQQQVEILKQQLAQAQRLTALGELVSTTTHEFNNVLMTILNYTKMGMRHKDVATRDKCFEKILASANRATTITNTVLGMARNRSAGQESTDLAKLVDTGGHVTGVDISEPMLNRAASWHPTARTSRSCWPTRRRIPSSPQARICCSPGSA